MGQDQSSPEPFDPSIPPEVLPSRDLKGVAEYILSGRCKRVVFMVGAGISTAAGIPDFRSPDTGLYSNLARLDLPHPEAVFDISFFRANPRPFYRLASELWPGKFAPTLTHVLMRLFAERGLLARCFTQNIDTLELAAGVPRDKLVFAHGSFASQSCIDCHAPFPRPELEAAVKRAEPPRCDRDGCGGLVKPDIVFFGESLPPEFFAGLRHAEEADLAIVMGSSLSVFPFASLPQRCPSTCPRVLVNMERAGDIGSRAEDVVWLGECDDGVRRLAEYLGWKEELEETWQRLREKVAKENGAEAGGGKGEAEGAERSIEDEVERLTREVDEGLKIAGQHREWVEDGLRKDGEKAKEKEKEKADEKGKEKQEEEEMAQAQAQDGVKQNL